MRKLILSLFLLFSLVSAKAQTTVQALADSSFAHQDYVKAADYYNQALTINPANVKNLRRMGFCVMNFKGQELSATRYFNDALKLQPNDPVSNYYLGKIYLDAAKRTADNTRKANFKALAQARLKDAAANGSKEATAAIKDLNAI